MDEERRDILILLEEASPPVSRAVYARRREELADAFLAFRRRKAAGAFPWSEGQLVVQTAEFLSFRIPGLLQEIEVLRETLEDFRHRYDRAASERERRDHILGLARMLGSRGRALAADRRALSRWFDREAVVSRWRHRVTEKEHGIVVCLELVAGMAERLFPEGADGGVHERVWKRIKLNEHLQPLLTYRGDVRVRVEAFRCLVRTIRFLEPGLRKTGVDRGIVAYAFRSSLDARQETWIQCEALTLLAGTSPEDLRNALRKRFSQPGEGDDLFVRRRAVQLLGRHAADVPGVDDLWPEALADPSPHVRQAVARAAARAGTRKGRKALFFLARKDPFSQVRAAAVLESARLLDDAASEALPGALHARVLEEEQDPYVLRTTLRAVRRVCGRLGSGAASAPAAAYAGRVRPALERVHRGHPQVRVRRWAAETRERLWVHMDPEGRRLYESLLERVQGIPPGKSRRVSSRVLGGVDESTLGRVLSVLAREDFGLTLERRFRGGRLHRGDRTGFRLWRLLYETFHPSPDKRQAFNHTLGRFTPGPVKAPSNVLAELTETRVPGEPLFIPEESGWRPFLPMVDDALSSLTLSLGSKPMRLYSGEGVTEVRPPRFPLGRMFAWTALTLRFARYAGLRNWTEQSRLEPGAYVNALRRLGFRIEFHPHASTAGEPDEDPAVRRFFPFLPPFLGPDLWVDLKDYFFSVYGNTLYELGLFAGGVLLFFAGRRVVLARAVRRARKRLPLVIGGWGTRGKSGTERIKAALFEALGVGVLSKTTGCEAMFLHAYPFGRTREMFLFRPYDKASIWEHHGLMRWAARARSDVFLWECMGLNPDFVRILQHDWSRDDYATITNAYPDHEDVQGPAGIDIPRVMAEFIPRERTLVTSEEEMLPVLSRAAQERGTRLRSVDWLEAGLLTKDVLERFPYKEHPSNIALVLALADELEIDRDFALKEMADRVVPDLGVLKAFPVARRRGKRVEFVNGMSANERFATLANWRRMGFEHQDPESEPGTLISTVVNNRADRVSRSRMFADIVAGDLSVDRHVLIGSNLKGLMGYIDQAFEKVLDRYDLRTSRRSPQETLEALARHLRVPRSARPIRGRLRAMLEDLTGGDPELLSLAELWEDPDRLEGRMREQEALRDHAAETAAHIRSELSRFREYASLSAAVSDPARRGDRDLDRRFRAQARSWFRGKLVVIRDVHASGEEIVKRIFEFTPSGLLHRVMGIQNIKGTGLDFVYRWQAWETCHRACQLLKEDDPESLRSGLDMLSGFQEYGLLSEETVRETLARARDLPSAQSERLQAGIGRTDAEVTSSMKDVHRDLEAARHRRGWLRSILLVVESFLDAGDAVGRRKRANRIYRDLLHERIGHERAALELKNLNRRQKGGWLLQGVLRVFHGKRP